MLRDESYGSPALHAVLGCFETEEESFVEVLQFRTLSADTFLWQLRFTDHIYYLVATDFVESLEQITSLLQVATDGTPGELVAVKQPLVFENASPVTASSVYEKPDDFDTKIAHYAAESGYDFVFLYQTDIASEDYESGL